MTPEVQPSRLRPVFVELPMAVLKYATIAIVWTFCAAVVVALMTITISVWRGDIRRETPPRTSYDARAAIEGVLIQEAIDQPREDACRASGWQWHRTYSADLNDPKVYGYCSMPTCYDSREQLVISEHGGFECKDTRDLDIHVFPGDADLPDDAVVLGMRPDGSFEVCSTKLTSPLLRPCSLAQMRPRQIEPVEHPRLTLVLGEH